MKFKKKWRLQSWKKACYLNTDGRAGPGRGFLVYISLACLWCLEMISTQPSCRASVVFLVPVQTCTSPTETRASFSPYHPHLHNTSSCLHRQHKFSFQVFKGVSWNSSSSHTVSVRLWIISALSYLKINKWRNEQSQGCKQVLSLPLRFPSQTAVFKRSCDLDWSDVTSVFVSSIAVYGTDTNTWPGQRSSAPSSNSDVTPLSPPPFLFMSSSSALLSIQQFLLFLQTLMANLSSLRINGTVHAKNTRDRAYASNAMRRAYPSPPLLPAPPRYHF